MGDLGDRRNTNRTVRGHIRRLEYANSGNPLVRETEGARIKRDFGAAVHELQYRGISGCELESLIAYLTAN
jgi:hypothetical protein